MIKGCKICGVSDSKTLNFIINYSPPHTFIGFICNYPKSPRFIKFDKLKKLLDINKKKIKNLPFDYYQLYDCTPDEIISIKKIYNKKIITALTIKEKSDVEKYTLFSEVTDIYLFDSKGYEKSEAFDHTLIEDIKLNKELMIAGNIKYNADLGNYGKIADYVDLSGGLETSGLKDLSKIKIFLNNIKNIKK